MDAEPILGRVLRAMRKHDLEAVLIGNAAGALHGAPVTTLDLDFMFRDTAVNLSETAKAKTKPQGSPRRARGRK